jgi:AraC-like DNA-binding protein
MDTVSIIIAVGILQGILLGIVLLTVRRGNRRANTILGILMVLFSVSLVDILTTRTGLYLQHPHLVIGSDTLIFLFGPFLLIYVQCLTRPDFTLRWYMLLHALPFLFDFVAESPFYSLSGPEKIYFLNHIDESTSLYDFIANPLQVIQIFIYLVIILRLLRSYETNLKEEYSAIDKINLSWVRTIVLLLGGTFFIKGILLIGFVTGFQSVMAAYGNGLIGVLASVSIYTIGYRGLVQPEIYLGPLDSELPKKYEGSRLTPEKADAFVQLLLQVMESHKPYLKSDLTLHDLSAMSTVPVNHLSQIINERFGQNFFDFINRYRIEEVKRRLSDPVQRYYTLIAIALDSGFNSKSVFNAAFRKHTGMTPSAYRSSLRTGTLS